MTPEERQMIGGLFERVQQAASAQRDPQAEAFINDAVRAQPYAPYVMAQTVLVQQQALEAAAHRIAELEAAAQEASERQGQSQQGGFLGGLSSIFGGGPSAPARPDPSAYRGPVPPQGQRGYAPPPPPPQPDPYAQAPQRGPWGAPSGGGGGGFLQNAMSTAAGVAGGVALGNLIGGLFSGGHGGMFGAGSAMAAPTETINNFYETGSDRGGDPGQIDPGVPDDAGFLDDSSFDDSSGGYDDV